jgi:hypothetical protein
VAIAVVDMIKNDEDLRAIRGAVLNGTPIPAQSLARLEALGTDVGALVERIRNAFAIGRLAQ